MLKFANSAMKLSSASCLTKVISGGQIGADEAGLISAKLSGLATGGTAPFGYRTQKGPNLNLRDVYGLSEHPSYNYKPRTIANVTDSDGTIIIAKNLNSPGCVLTAKSATKLNKPLLRILVPDRELTTEELNDHVETMIQFLKECHISVVNIAGNRDHLKCDYPLIEHCKAILIPAFMECKYEPTQ